MSDLGWSDPRIAQLKKLWQEGLSASQIARQLGGVTRNAVIGKVHRLGLANSGRAAPARPGRVATRAPRAPRERSRPVRAPLPPPPAGGPPMIAERQAMRVVEHCPGLATPLTLGAHMCKWPIGDPLEDGFTHCGRRAEGPYCVEHAQLAYKPAPAKPLHADPAIRRALAG